MSEDARAWKPKLRAIDVFPVEIEGKKGLCLRDPMGIADGPAIFPLEPFLIFLIQRFDGENSLGDIQLELLRRSQQMVLCEQIAEFAQLLDKHGYLEGPGFEERVERKRQEYLDAPERPCAVIIGSDHQAREELRGQFARDAAHPLGPEGSPAALPAGRALGILAPHIDYLRGGYAYAWAYQALAQGAAEARLFVVLGTAHHSMRVPFAATAKPFRTPFGRVPVNRPFLDALRARLATFDLFGDEFAHATEHSIELQVLYLQRALAERRVEWSIAPILVDSFDHDLREGRAPEKRPEVLEFIEALRALLEEWPEPAALVAGVDFSHVGPRFATQETSLTDGEMEEVARRDREALDRIEALDAEGFLESFRRDGNARNVCSVAPIYCALRALAGRAAGKTLRYGQALDPDRMGAVTFAGVVFTDAADGGAARRAPDGPSA